MSIIEAWQFFLFLSLSFNAIHAIREYDQQNDHIFQFCSLHILCFTLSCPFSFLCPWTIILHFSRFGLFPMHMHPLGFILFFGKIFISLFVSFAYSVRTGDLHGWHNCFQAFFYLFSVSFHCLFDFYTAFLLLYYLVK